MDEFPHNFYPLICDDCGNETGQFFRDDESGDCICIDCLLERRSQWQNEQEREEENENDDRDEPLQIVADPNYFNPDIYPEEETRA